MVALTWSQRLARWAYSCLWYALSPFYVLKLWWRSRREPLYGKYVKERFGFYPRFPASSKADCYVWVHAVSLGETRAAAVLVDALRQQMPQMKLLLTHGTATGRAQGMALLREGDVQCWLPVDTPTAVSRFMRRFKPVIGLLMETEIWPNLIYGASRSGIPMVLVNARLSERSLKKAQKVQALLKPAYQALTVVLAQSEDDGRRFEEAGVCKVDVLGNLKYDMRPDADLLAQGQHWKSVCMRPVVMAASTRDGEELCLLQAWNAAPWQALPQDRQPVLLLVPRHPQRFDAVEQLVVDAGLSCLRRSAWNGIRCDQSVQVWLGDTLGEMPLYYGLSDMVLLGGSFKRFGGQNLLEALACRCPVIMGAYTYNFAQASELAECAGVAVRVGSFQQALQQVARWLEEPQRLQLLQSDANAFISQHQGVARKTAVCIGEILGSSVGGCS